MILVFNIYSIFNLLTLTYMKCYTNLSRNLMNYRNPHKHFLIWFFNCFHLCQAINSVLIIINGKNFTFVTNFIFLIALISVKCLQSTTFKVKCYRGFINLKTCESVKKKSDEYPSARVSTKQLNFLNILMLFLMPPLLLYFLAPFNIFHRFVWIFLYIFN